MTKPGLHRSTRAKDQSRAEAFTKRAGYASGGAVTPAKAVHEHESSLHKGQPKTKIAKCGGGSVHGEMPSGNLGKRSRGGKAPAPIVPSGSRRKLKQPQINVDREIPPPNKRASGGAVKKGGVNIIVKTGEDPAKLQAAEQAGVKKGMMMAAGMAKQAMGGGAPPGGPPPGPPPMAGPPPGGPPPGAGGPVPGGPPPMPMRARGGSITKTPAASEIVARKAGPARLERMKLTGERKGEITAKVRK